MKTTKQTEPQRRHSEGVGLLRVLPHTKFKRAVTMTRAVIRFKNSQKDKSKKDEDDAEPTSTGQLRRCDRCLSASKGPSVICLSAASGNQQTYEDSMRRGKGMTTKLLKALKREHSIKLGVLDQKLKKSLYKLSFKRVRKALAAFRSLSKIVSPKQRERWRGKYTARGAFVYRDQTVHIGTSRSVGPDEKFLLKRVYRGPVPD